MDWSHAYAESLVDARKRFRKLRAQGSTKSVELPGTTNTERICDLEDDDIESIAIAHAEKYTNRAINQYKERYGKE